MKKYTVYSTGSLTQSIYYLLATAAARISREPPRKKNILIKKAHYCIILV